MRYTPIGTTFVGLALIILLPFAPSAQAADCVKVGSLTWEVKTDNGGLRDKDNTYSWFAGNGPIQDSGGNAGTPCNGAAPCDTFRYIQAINAQKLCGYSDWRLPTLAELKSLVNTDEQPTIDPVKFPNTRAGAYWTAGTQVNNTGAAWYVGFDNGQPEAGGKDWGLYVRLVRGDQAPPVCVREGNLLWEAKDDKGGLRAFDNRYTWYDPNSATNGGNAGTIGGLGSCIGLLKCDTFQYIRALNARGACGFANWRMPTLAELKSLVNTDEQPTIDPVKFPNTAAGAYWTRETPNNNPGAAWYVGFDNGQPEAGGKDWGLYARLVSPQDRCGANLLQNGSFETFQGTNPGASYRRIPPGSSDLTGWTAGGLGVDLLGTYWKAASGNFSIDLDDTPGPGTLTQVFATTPGKTYTVMFNLAGNPDGYNKGADNAPVKNLRVSAAGKQADFSFDVRGKTVANMGWQNKVWQFPATTAQTTLRFASLSTNASSLYGPAIDNVRVFETTATNCGCSYGFTPAVRLFTKAGGTGAIAVTATGGCPWAASSNANWITVTQGKTGAGSGTVAFSVTANPNNSQRSSVITIAGRNFTVAQSGKTCNYAITPTSAAFPSAGGNSGVNLTTVKGCSWTASSNATWLKITANGGGDASAKVNFRVAANPNTTARTATLTIADKLFTVTQAGK
jgi:choice-of-anchor C domain-containing protein